jgi:hypothetical protein
MILTEAASRNHRSCQELRPAATAGYSRHRKQHMKVTQYLTYTSQQACLAELYPQEGSPDALVHTFLAHGWRVKTVNNAVIVVLCWRYLAFVAFMTCSSAERAWHRRQCIWSEFVCQAPVLSMCATGVVDCSCLLWLCLRSAPTSSSCIWASCGLSTAHTTLAQTCDWKAGAA